MEKFHLLNDFIDGSLAPDQEEQFFLHLSSNEEMRLKLKQMMTVKTAIQGNTAVFTPPAEATMGVFGALGFSTAGVGGAAVVNPGLISRVSGVFSKYSHAIIASSVATVITIIIMLMLLNPGNYSSLDSSILLSGSTDVAVNKGSSHPVIPVVESKEAEEKTSPATENVKTVIKYVYVQAPEQNSEETVTAQNNPQEISHINAFSTSPASPDYSLSGQRPLLQTGLMPESNSVLFSDMGHTDLGLSIEVRGAQYWSMPDPTISPSKFAEFNNNALALFYNIDDEIKLGLELRQENFFQEFYGIDMHGVKTYYEQQPNFTSISLAARYVEKDWFTYFNPYAQGTIGLNNSGYVWRGMLGLEYTPFHPISFIAGLEYSHLVFNHQDEIFNSKKFGFNYGVTVRF